MVSSRSWPGWGTPRCSSNISLATEKMVVLAPMARASEATAMRSEARALAQDSKTVAKVFAQLVPPAQPQ